MVLRAAAALFVALLAAGLAAAQSPAPATGGAVPAAVLDDLVIANRILADRGIIDAYGHLSIRHPTDPNRYLMARAIAPALITLDDIMEFDLDSNPVDRRGRSMFIERYIHGEIYKARPDVQAVVHSHSSGVIPFGITGMPLRPVYHTASFLWVGVPVFEIRDAGGVTDMLVRSPALGKALAATLGDKPVALMRGHGDVVVGRNLRQAVSRAVWTEENARIQAIALSFGGPINYISPDEGAARDKRPGDPDRAWELWSAQARAKMRQ